DKSGFLTLKTSAGVVVDDHLDHDGTCHGSWSREGLIVSFFVKVPPSDASSNDTDILSIQVAASVSGQTATKQATTIGLVGSGRIWNSPEVCKTTLTLNQEIGTSGTYKVAGGVRCSGPVPETFGREGLSIDKLEFVVAAVPNDVALARFVSSG